MVFEKNDLKKLFKKNLLIENIGKSENNILREREN